MDHLMEEIVKPGDRHYHRIVNSGCLIDLDESRVDRQKRGIAPVSVDEENRGQIKEEKCADVCERKQLEPDKRRKERLFLFA